MTSIDCSVHPTGSVDPARRRFTGTALGLFAAAGIAPLFVSLAAGAQGAESAALNADEVAIAQLGALLLASQPEVAASLEMTVRRQLAVGSADTVDRATARQSQSLLNDRQAIAAQLSRREVVFVDGWLLAHTEAGVALLYALAHDASRAESAVAGK